MLNSQINIQNKFHISAYPLHYSLKRKDHLQKNIWIKTLKN